MIRPGVSGQGYPGRAHYKYSIAQMRALCMISGKKPAAISKNGAQQKKRK
jgi:hypothetical protein